MTFVAVTSRKYLLGGKHEFVLSLEGIFDVVFLEIFDDGIDVSVGFDILGNADIKPAVMGIDFQNDAAFAGFGDGVIGIDIIAEAAPILFADIADGIGVQTRRLLDETEENHAALIMVRYGFEILGKLTLAGDACKNILVVGLQHDGAAAQRSELFKAGVFDPVVVFDVGDADQTSVAFVDVVFLSGGDGN